MQRVDVAFGAVSSARPSVLHGSHDQAAISAPHQLDPSSCLFFARAPPDVTTEQLSALFGQFGAVKDINLYRRWPTAKASKGCGTVQFTDAQSAAAAFKALNGVYKFPGADTPVVIERLDPKKIHKPVKQTSPRDPAPVYDQQRYPINSGSCPTGLHDLGSTSLANIDNNTLGALLAAAASEALSMSMQSAAMSIADYTIPAQMPQLSSWAGTVSASLSGNANSSCGSNSISIGPAPRNHGCSSCPDLRGGNSWDANCGSAGMLCHTPVRDAPMPANVLLLQQARAIAAAAQHAQAPINYGLSNSAPSGSIIGTTIGSNDLALPNSIGSGYGIQALQALDGSACQLEALSSQIFSPPSSLPLAPMASASSDRTVAAQRELQLTITSDMLSALAGGLAHVVALSGAKIQARPQSGGFVLSIVGTEAQVMAASEHLQLIMKHVHQQAGAIATQLV